MSIYLGQLPPAELARLKAELAETLIASFCYPRFYDYRTGTLRMRPVDRSKRQEVWLYLSSFDFTAWNRVDLLSPDFQYHIERLFIQFVQRNRSFFGEQGRKRLSDVRMLISTCAASVAEDLRDHLTGQNKNRPPFGSPRPVPSWATTNVTGHAEPGWERIAQSTFLLQQQVQEWRGEIKGVPQLPIPGQSEVARAQTPSPASKRTARGAGTTKTANGSQQDHVSVVQAVPAQEGARNGTGNGSAVSTPATRASGPLYPPAPSPKASGPLQPPPQTSTQSVTPVLAGEPGSRGGAANGKSGPLSSPMQQAPAPKVSTAPTLPVPSVTAEALVEAAAAAASSASQMPAPVQQNFPAATQIPAQEPVKTSAPSRQEPAKPAQARSMSQPVVPSPASVAAAQRDTGASALSGEDVAIFEQLRHQLLLWLRIEAVQCGLDISGQSAGQLLDFLRQQDGVDETHLQVVSNLLNLANQVMKNGQASLLDYKQAMMFHLMHTRSRRLS
ncbi:MAG TPA: hypothetical protein VKV40_08145 [Ktedonobacteraceae bacterium]|nr:hypothetical protein [Ktedonobacteraceae bacterium]